MAFVSYKVDINTILDKNPVGTICDKPHTETITTGRTYCNKSGFVVIETTIWFFIFIPHPDGCLRTFMTITETLTTFWLCILDELVDFSDYNWVQEIGPGPIIVDPVNPTGPPPENPRGRIESPFPETSCKLSEITPTYKIECKEDGFYYVSRILNIVVSRPVSINPLLCYVLRQQVVETYKTSELCDPLDPIDQSTAEEAWRKYWETKDETMEHDKIEFGDETKTSSVFDDSLNKIHKKEIESGLKEISKPRKVFINSIEGKPATIENLFLLKPNDVANFVISISDSKFTSELKLRILDKASFDIKVL